MLPVLTEIPDQKWADHARRLDAGLRKHAPELAHARVAPWHDEALLVVDEGLPWIVTPFERDPLRNAEGGYPFPKDVKQSLMALAGRGVDFDNLAVAHELDPHGPVAALLGKIPPHGLICDAASTKALVGQAPATELTKRMASTLNRTGDAAAKSAPKVLIGLALAPVLVAAAPLALLAAAGNVIDPVVFGVLHVDHTKDRQLSLWYPLAAWKW